MEAHAEGLEGRSHRAEVLATFAAQGRVYLKESLTYSQLPRPCLNLCPGPSLLLENRFRRLFGPRYQDNRETCALRFRGFRQLSLKSMNRTRASWRVV